MNEKQAPLSVRDLRVTIGGNPILRKVNLTFPRNRITCIIGPSGCGKSTLLKTLNRMHYNVEGLQVSGSVLLGEHDVIRASDQELLELRRNIGLVPQKPCHLPMSIFDNVAYGCRIHGLYRKQELPDVVEKYLSEVGLWEEVKDRLGSPAIRLSLGQQQRLCLARTLALEPEYILADESTSALDPISSKTVEDLFIKLKKDYSIIMVTHTLHQARRIADHAVFLYLGEVIEEGPAADLFSQPQEAPTRNYLSGVFS
jgi:phosphate transport system ATP-binding protein